jgi:hypothetical protein
MALAVGGICVAVGAIIALTVASYTNASDTVYKWGILSMIGGFVLVPFGYVLLKRGGFVASVGKAGAASAITPKATTTAGAGAGTNPDALRNTRGARTFTSRYSARGLQIGSVLGGATLMRLCLTLIFARSTDAGSEALAALAVAALYVAACFGVGFLVGKARDARSKK